MPTTIAQESEREMWPAIWRGVKCKCPKCGKGKLFSAYLKTDESCSNCGEDFSHHRADDLPPYLALLIVGHLLVGIVMHLEMTWDISPSVYLTALIPAAIILPLVMLPSLKGGVIGLQWALRMHGFGTSNKNEDC